MITEQELSIQLGQARNFILEHMDDTPELGIVLGSGLGSFANMLDNKTVISYADIPHFPVSTVEGHSGKLVLGEINQKKIMVLQGRFHFYEGYEMHEVTFPVRLMQTLGIEGLIVTNAAGGVNTGFRPGDLILIKDHINLMGVNPLRGANLSSLGPRFPDLSEAYDSEWRQKALNMMQELALVPQEGVYAAVSGPSYETPAEIKYLRTIGADLVGMSTAPEVIVANHGGMKVLGISCVTNMAAGILSQKLNHKEVIETTERIEKQFVRLLQTIIRDL